MPGSSSKSFLPFFAWAAAAQVAPFPDTADPLLREAAENAYRGGYSAEVLFIRDSFLGSVDSLRGKLAIDDAAGERSLRLAGRHAACVWWSRDHGREQWWKDEKTDRLRRIPFHSLKKPVFGSLLAYEDLLKLPAGYLMDFQSCRKLAETDSTCEFNLTLKPTPGSRYGSLDVTLRKRPALIRRLVFFGYDGRLLKSLEVTDYRSEGGKFLPTGFRLCDGDTLSSLRFSLRQPRMGRPIAAGSDHTAVSQAAFPPPRMPDDFPPEAQIAAPEDASLPGEDSTSEEE